MKKSFYLVDVSSLFFRAYYAIRPLTSPAGVPVNAVYGFYSMIFKLLKEEKPDYLVFCYDRKDPSFRKEIYSEYKANRTEMPDDLAVQIPYIKQFADFIGIPSIEAPQYEADDVIGTLVRTAQSADCLTYIVSGDKDFAQLLNDQVYLFDTMKNVKMTPALAKEKWGILPSQMIDYLALVGDSSDNVPGVTGIGPKGAVKLIEQFGSLEKIYENINDVSSDSIRNKLLASKENAFLSQRLVTIECSVPIPMDIHHYHFRDPQTAALEGLLNELNFQQMKKNLTEVLSSLQAAQQRDTQDSKQELDFETLFPQQGHVPAETLSDSTMTPSESVTWIVREITEWSEFISQASVSLSSGLGFFAREESVFLAILQDKTCFYLRSNEFLIPQIQEFILQHKPLHFFGFDVKCCLRQIFGQRYEQIDYGLIWDSQLLAYALQAADCTEPKKVFKRFLKEEIAGEDHLLVQQHLNLYQNLISSPSFLGQSVADIEKVYQELDRPLSAVLYKMECKGIKIDLSFLKQMSQELKTDIEGLQKQIHEIAGEEFNISSPKQLGQILFQKLGIESSKKTKTGFSTDTDVLEKVTHPIAKLILEYRELTKLKSTYVDSLPELVDPRTHRVHTYLNQALTATGRLSSTTPNLQNIPIRTARGRMVRRAFIADAGRKLLSIDYSQIELRILAHIADDANLIRAFHEDLDIHTATAAEVFHVPLQEVTSDLRRTAKAINFGIAYGQGAFGLAESLGISRTEAKDIITRYFKQFQGVQNYIESTIRLAHENGYVETLFGRRRYIEELQSKNAMMKSFGERAAINAPIQGTASDLIKKAMIQISSVTKLDLLLQVHDELIFEGTKEQIEAELKSLKATMENVIQLKVPLKVNAAFGLNWDEAH